MTVRLTEVSAGEATVTLDGVEIGHVQRREQHYNLRRAFTVRYWRAYANGVGGTDCDTRRDAVESVVQMHASGKST